ncbi:ACP S-malonyltransferase [Brevibacillus laterosporus]
MTTYRVFMEEIGLLPAFSMGYSLGEYSALVCAGAIEFKDALQMVQERGDVVSDVSNRISGTMAWVTNIDSRTVEQICEEVSQTGDEVYVSAYDTPLKTSISGTNTAIRKAGEKVVEAGGIAIPIKMSGPFHSPLMIEAANKFKEILIKYNYQQPQYPVLSNYSAHPFTDHASIIENLSLQLVSLFVGKNHYTMAYHEELTWQSSLGQKQCSSICWRTTPRNVPYIHLTKQKIYKQ